MHEQWKVIAGFENYEVSDFGRVRNLGGYLVNKRKDGSGGRLVPARDIRPFAVKSTGYLQVLLPDRRKHSIHRLVAVAFCEGHAPGLVVDHINNDRADNRAVNLRWVEHAFNISRPYREGTKTPWATGRLGALAPKTTAIVGRRIEDGVERRWDCASDAVREMGFDSGCISRCCSGRYRFHKGWQFRFADGALGYPHHRTSLGREVPDEVAA